LVVLLTGLALIAAGIVCLFLSDRGTGGGPWWQGTLNAFGVGFAAGGLVDVVVASLLDQVVNRTEAARQNSLRANRILAELDEPGAMVQSPVRLWVLGPGQLVVLLTGLALIVAGIVCLFLSSTVAAKGSWWQGTLGPFGVGFAVAGLVDVMAASLLDWVVNGAETVRQNSLRAIGIYQAAPETQKTKAAAEILAMCGGQILDDYREALLNMVMSDDLRGSRKPKNLKTVRPGRAFPQWANHEWSNGLLPNA
jgi:hypothetical protein